MIFSVVDLPEPLAPRMIFVWPEISVKLMFLRITLSSKASCTWSNTTTGAPGSLRISSTVCGVALSSMSVKQFDQHLCDEVIGGNPPHRSGDDRHCRRLADALRAAARPQPHVTRR